MRSITLLALALLAAPLSAQGRTLDQVSSYHNLSANLALPGWIWEQDIRVGISGDLAALELSLNSFVANDKCSIEILSGQVGSGGAILWSGRVGPQQRNVWENVQIDLLPFGLHFAANDFFTVRLYADSVGMGFLGNSLWPNDEYPAGRLYENGSPLGANDNLGFRTWMWTGPNLTVTGSCPGNVLIEASGGQPGGAMAILHGAPGQFVQSDPGRPCLGVALYLSVPTFAGFLNLNAAGAGQLQINLPAAACGRVLQLVDLGSCLATQPVLLD